LVQVASLLLQRCPLVDKILIFKEGKSFKDDWIRVRLPEWLEFIFKSLGIKGHSETDFFVDEQEESEDDLEEEEDDVDNEFGYMEYEYGEY